MESSKTVKYTGSCHCGTVKFEVVTPTILHVFSCNCSICKKKQNKHFIVPAKDFKLMEGHTSLTTYTFGTHQAKHLFCSKCGVQSFYIPRSSPEGYGIMPHCLDWPKTGKIIIKEFDGQNWEKSINNLGPNKTPEAVKASTK